MSTLAIQALAILIVAVHLRSSVRASATFLLLSVFLVPGTILFPGAPAYAFVVRLGLWAACAGIIVRAATGEISRTSVRPSRVLVALGLFVGVCYVIGVAAGPFPSRSERAFEIWLLLVDQLLFLWAATVFVRELGVRYIARIAVIGVVAAASIAVLERVLGGSYAHWWFRHQPGFLGGQQLETRGGEVRVRATAEFALQFAWVLALFAPLVGLLALRSRRLLAMAAPVVVGIAIVLTTTRSVFAGVGAGALLLLLFARADRRIIGALAAGAVVAAVLYLGAGTVRDPYQAADPESRTVRTRRLHVLANELSRKPWFGLGLDGTAQRGIVSTDSAFLSTYAGAGVVGLAALVGTLGTAALTVGAAARLADDDNAPLAGALLGGLAAGTLGMFAFDGLSAPIAAWNLWLLAALGVGLYEEVVAARAGPLRPRRVQLRPRRLLLPLIGLGIGSTVLLMTPSAVAAQYRIFTLNPQYLTRFGNSSADFVGRVLVQATCDAASESLGSTAKLDCFDPLSQGPGTGVARLQASTPGRLATAQAVFFEIARRVHPTTKVTLAEPYSKSKPTWARTAPIVGLLLGAEAALLIPPLRVRRRIRRVTSGRLLGRASPVPVSR